MTVSVAKAKKRDSGRPHHHCRPESRGAVRISIRKLPRRENPPKTNEWRCSENLGFSLFSRLHFGPKGVTLWNHSDSFPEKSLRNPRRPPYNRQNRTREIRPAPSPAICFGTSTARTRKAPRGKQRPLPPRPAPPVSFSVCSPSCSARHSACAKRLCMQLTSSPDMPGIWA